MTFKTNERSQSWTIFRRYSQFYELETVLKEATLPLQINLPSKTTSQNFHPDFIQDRIQVSNSWFQDVCNCMGEIVTNENTLYGFAKFAAPVQYGDIRPNGFVMPFPL